MFPQWATPERRAHLVRLFQESGGFCIFGHKPCPHEAHHFENFIEGLIDEWKGDDREERAAQRELEQRALLPTVEPGRWKPERSSSWPDPSSIWKASG